MKYILLTLIILMIIVPVLAVNPYQGMTYPGMTEVRSQDGNYITYVSSTDNVIYQTISTPPLEGSLVNSYPGSATYFFKADNGTDYMMQYNYEISSQNVGFIQGIINVIEGVV